MIPAGLKAEGTRLTAEIRQDPAVAFQLWQSATLDNWMSAALQPAADQSGVAPGFVRMEASRAAGFYRMSFSL